MEFETRNLKYTNGLPAISVIVPVYNSERVLRECVDSILSQNFKDFELLLIDDGSKDTSPQICDEYAKRDSRIKVYHKTNGGVSSARNLGLDYAQGQWIAFIDSDDYITSNYFVNVLNQDEDLLVCSYSKFNEFGVVDKIEVILEPVFLDFINYNLVDSLLRCPWAKFYKKELIDNLRFLPDMKIGEDAYFVFKYLSKCKSYSVLRGGEYMVRLAEEPDEVKYAISVDYAVNSLNHLKKAYDGLVQVHGINKSYFLSYIGYFKRISKADWQNDKNKWYANKDVKALYGYVWPALSFSQKLRLTAARILRK